jgi:hypothetical protein
LLLLLLQQRSSSCCSSAAAAAAEPALLLLLLQVVAVVPNTPTAMAPEPSHKEEEGLHEPSHMCVVRTNLSCLQAVQVLHQHEPFRLHALP